MNLTRFLRRDAVPHLCQQVYFRGRTAIDSTAARALFRFWGIQFGSSVQFIGVPAVRRAPNSTITVGRGCKFISVFSANSHGVTRPCFVSALSPGSEIRFGENCGFSGTIVTAAERIVLGDRVQCGANTLITDSDAHSLDASVRRAEIEGKLRGLSNQAISKPVIIHDDVWLGMGVTVLKGVEIGARSVIGAGSLVTKSIPPDSLAAGIPARVIKSLAS